MPFQPAIKPNQTSHNNQYGIQKNLTLKNITFSGPSGLSSPSGQLGPSGQSGSNNQNNTSSIENLTSLRNYERESKRTSEKYDKEYLPVSELLNDGTIKSKLNNIKIYENQRESFDKNLKEPTHSKLNPYDFGLKDAKETKEIKENHDYANEISTKDHKDIKKKKDNIDNDIYNTSNSFLSLNPVPKWAGDKPNNFFLDESRVVVNRGTATTIGIRLDKLSGKELIDKIIDLEAINIELNSYNKILKDRNEILQKETNYLRNEKEEYKRLYEDSFNKYHPVSNGTGNQSQDQIKNSRQQLNKMESNETFKDNTLTKIANIGLLRSNKQIDPDKTEKTEKKLEMNELSKKHLRFNHNENDTSIIDINYKLNDKTFDLSYDTCKKTLNEVSHYVYYSFYIRLSYVRYLVFKIQIC